MNACSGRVALLVVSALLASAPTAQAEAQDFVGTAICRGCHEASFSAWQGSHHDDAMQHAASGTVLGDFDDAEFTYGGVTSRFHRRDGDYFVRTDGPDGELRDYRVAFTFGVTPLQQYLVPMPDGRLQALGIAWDSRPAAEGGQRWFHLYPDDGVDHRHALHWTGDQQNWNYMCAACHSTNLDKRFDPAADRFDTRWSEIDVGCEACHGPGAAHVRWAAEPAAQRSAEAHRGFGDFTLGRHVAWPIDPDSGSPTVQQGPPSLQVDVCADCHSRRGELAPGAATSPRFLDHHAPAFLTEGLYHADGQIDDEVYVWGSFVQSRMHEAGVVCSNCHEPHSLALRAPGDAVCAQCHAPEHFASTTHHHHEPDGAGASCLDCHMPAGTYMRVDSRRDHGLRVPRPDLSEALGTPNACNACHADRSVAWAAGHFRDWYPQRAAEPHAWAETLDRARTGDPGAAAALRALVTDDAMPAIVRGTAMLELSSSTSADSTDTLTAALRSPAPLLRMAGLRALAALPPAQRLALGGGLVDDPLLAVRAEAGRVLAAVPATRMTEAEGGRGRVDAAVADYIATQEHNADRPEAHTNLGTLFAGRGDWRRAEAAYRKALDIDARHVPALVNLAELLRRTGRDGPARSLLEQALRQQVTGNQPASAELHHALGLQQVRQGDMQAAVASLQTAARLDPGTPRFSYVYAIALNGSSRPVRALEVLSDAIERHPHDRDIRLALVTINLETGHHAEARRHLTTLIEARPEDDDVRALTRMFDGRD